ncbi:hypothetical protein UlMin_039651 [Ulmus minor]
MTNFLRRSTTTTFALAFHRYHFKTHQYSRRFSHFTGDFELESWKSMEGLVRSPANFSPLSPISFLERAAMAYRDNTSLIFGSMKFTWRETHNRCLQLASALTQLGICRGDVVATLAHNVPAMYELHFGVPMAGGVLCTLNARHDSAMVSSLLKHSEAKIIFVDHQLLEIARGALDLLAKEDTKLPILVLISDCSYNSVDSHEYENLISNGSDGFEIRKPKSEWDPISINYTSGTTSRPKGVVYSHRGAYLNALATVLLHGMGSMPVYLWTVPMFHCNGWCLPWGTAAQGATRAPTVLNMLVNSPETDRKPLPHTVEVLTGGSPPPPQILAKMEELGFRVNHIYGLTETYGPATNCVWKPEFDALPLEEKYRIKARQGLRHLGLEEVDVKDPITMESVPADGRTIGEVMLRGNTVMSGYLKDLKATEEAFKGGWFRSGDLGVKHSDDFIQLKDRSKDVIISGGENISSVEVETLLYSHEAVLEAAVVARPDEHWGETPCAFVKLKDGFDQVSENDIIGFCRDRLPHYMAPKSVVFEDIPKTSTGKIQKFILRERAKALGSLS